jgi:membrane protease YdiL (CAAX protease family)
MRPTALFIAYLAAALIIGALLAYPIYLAATPLINEPMYRFVTRSSMLVALIGPVFFLRYLDLDIKQALGYALPRRQFIAAMLVGLVAGVITMLPLIFTLVALDVRQVEPGWIFSWPDLMITVLEGLVTGLVVALIEETFFRGAMFTAVNRGSGLWPAAALTSLLYATLHFISTDYTVPTNELEWYSGLVVLGHMFEQFANPVMILDSFLALFAVGMFLALVRAKTGHIALCIGLHAGWVLTIKLTKDITYVDRGAEFSFLVGSYDNVIGYLALLLMGALTIIYYLLALRGRIASQESH